MCDKIGYETYKLAMAAIRAISKRDKQSMKVYKCPECFLFHAATRGKKKFIKTIQHPIAMDLKPNPKIPPPIKQKSLERSMFKMINKEQAILLKRKIDG